MGDQCFTSKRHVWQQQRLAGWYYCVSVMCDCCILGSLCNCVLAFLEVFSDQEKIPNLPDGYSSKKCVSSPAWVQRRRPLWLSKKGRIRFHGRWTATGTIDWVFGMFIVCNSAHQLLIFNYCAFSHIPLVLVNCESIDELWVRHFQNIGKLKLLIAVNHNPRLMVISWLLKHPCLHCFTVTYQNSQLCGKRQHRSQFELGRKCEVRWRFGNVGFLIPEGAPLEFRVVGQTMTTL